MSRTIIVNGVSMDLDAELEANRRKWKAIPQDKKDPVFEMVRQELTPTVQEAIRKAIGDSPNKWWVDYHFGWGMGFRNLLREKGFPEAYWPVDNLDDIYTYIVEDSINPPAPAQVSGESPANDRPCYVAKCRKCNGWVGVTVDSPKDKTNDIAEDVSRWIKAGYYIERLTVDQFKDPANLICECHKNKQRQMFP